MRLVMSSQLTPSDFAFLKQAFSEGKDYGHIFENVSMSSTDFENLIERNHFEAMCWLMARGRLELRIVVYQGEEIKSHDPIFHPKVGIFTDAIGDRVSFSGSINETVSGWLGNIEEFKVFKSWEAGTVHFVETDEELFKRHWETGSHGNFITVTLPDAIAARMISEAPEDVPDLTTGTTRTGSTTPQVVLRDYQDVAIGKWCEAGFKGLLAMATGTGKTKTAKGCLEQALKQGDTLVVVTAPFEHIAKQWMVELSEYSPVLASSSNDWKTQLRSAESKKQLKRIKNLVVIAVQKTSASPYFVNQIQLLSSKFEHSMFIGDEAHGLGAASYKAAMDDVYNFRLGLSATPERYFDEVGSDAIMNFFGEVVYEFKTSEALAWRDPKTGKRALCDYKYYPEFVHLNAEEIAKFDSFSEKIAAAIGASKESGDTGALETLLFQRAAVVKKAESKLDAFRSLVGERKEDLAFTLIYCHDLEQLAKVGEILASIGISYQKVTGEESNSPSPRYNGLSERDWILKKFAEGVTRVLLAIKCLDEGVDIPDARNAYILASSGNPREFIQRRGRLLRPSATKQFATIYDFVVAPKPGASAPEELSPAVFKKELERIQEFASDSINEEEVMLKIGNVLLGMGD